jgi:TonB-dependent SusC/RagA subfamily outer membrane receptor
MKRSKTLISILILCLSLPLMAAKLEIGGVVTDAATGENLPGANILVKGTTLGAASDLDGRFTFTYETETSFQIVVSYMGYKTKEQTLAPGDNVSNLSIALEEDVFRGETVVVTGIASRTSKDVAEVSVSRVQASELTVTNTYQDLSEMVNGKVSGVQVQSASGTVGGGFRFNMRSTGGLNGDEQPVVYVDGVRVDNQELILIDLGGQGMSTMADINPEDIESVEILKGPAGAASYGTNGSNGVVLITTKRGTMVPGKAKGLSIDYKMVTGLNTPSYTFSKEDEYLSYKDLNDVFQDGIIQQNSLSLYGGTGLMKYYVSLDRRKEGGILPTNHMDRKTVRANVDVFPSDKFAMRMSTSYTMNEIQLPPNDNNIFGYLGNTFLTYPAYYLTPLESIKAVQNTTENDRYIGSFEAEYNPIRNLQFKASIGLDEGDYRSMELFPANMYYLLFPAGEKVLYYRKNKQYTYNFNAQYTYSPLRDLTITSVLGSQVFDRYLHNFYEAKEEFATELVTNIDAGDVLTDNLEHSRNERQAGIFTEHNFNYKNQYFLTAMLRKDYASVVGIQAPSILYPGASFAIRMDQYDWFPKMFNLMKLRTAYGETGVLPTYLDGVALFWKAEQSGYGVGAVLDAIGNAKIEPERIKEVELGFESELWNKYAVELTYYKMNAVNSIVDFENAPSTGKTASEVPFNIGKSEGWGIESMIQARPVQTQNVKLDLSLINNYQKNKVIDLGGAQPIYDGSNAVNVIMEGLPKYGFYAEKVLGAQYDEDGYYWGDAILSNDKVYIGNPVPEYSGSFKVQVELFKNLNVSVLTNWALNYWMYNNTKQFAIYFGDNHQRWRELQELLGLGDYEDLELTPLEVGSAAYKAAAEEHVRLHWFYNSNFIEEADYLKLDEVSISYSLNDLLSKVYHAPLVNDLVIGVSGRNLWTTTKYSGADPVLMSDGSRSLARGLDFLTLMHPTVYNLWLRISL